MAGSTNPEGVYRFPALAEGVWSMRVEMLGFSPLTRDVMVGPDASSTSSPAAIALSNGASSSTTNADLPPSSRQTFLMPSPASDATRRPACSDPVKLTMSTSGCADDGFADDAARAADDVEHAGRQADLVRGLGEHERAERRELRRLQHHGAAGGQRRRDLRDDLVQRIVPRRHAADDADRLLDDERIAELFFERGPRG